MRSKKPEQAESPEIFRYHDYQAFLKDWLAYRKASQPGFSLRTLAKRAGLAAGYLPMVLGGKRPLTAKALSKLAPFLGLNASEQSFLESLLVLGTSGFHEAHLGALERMKRFQLYQKLNPRETEVYQYLTHWYYVAIREMAALPGFQLNAAWIQERLCVSVPLSEVKAALEFLLRNDFLKTNEAGGVEPLDAKALDCTGGVYRVALSQFHREIFDLAAKAIQNFPREERNIQGHTFALSEKGYATAQAILEEAIQKVQRLGEMEKSGDSVYHMEIALFPLTKRRV